MIRTIPAIAVVALIPAAAPAQDACSLLTPDQIKAALNSPVEAGQPGLVKDSNECTWSDDRGVDRVFLALRPGADFQKARTNIAKAGGHPTPATGLGEDAFFLSSDESAALYVLAKNHFILLTVTLPDGAQETNQAAEKALATQILPKL